MMPRCFNRGPLVDPNAGWRPTGDYALRHDRPKPIYRYRWPWFDDVCRTWDGVGIGQPTEEFPNGTPYPIAHGWQAWCARCRHLPARAASTSAMASFMLDTSATGSPRQS